MKWERGQKKRRGKKEKSSTYSFTREGTPRGQLQRHTVKLKRSKSSVTSRLLHTGRGHWAPAAPAAATESRSPPHSGWSPLGHRPSWAWQHPRGAPTAASRVLPSPFLTATTCRHLQQISGSSSNPAQRSNAAAPRSHCFSDTTLRNHSEI